MLLSVATGGALRGSRNLKLGLGLTLIILALPTLFIQLNIPTDTYRNVFFYADALTAHHLLATGNLPPEEVFGQYSNQVRWYWGKVFNRSSLPIYPASLAVLSRLSGLTPAFFYSRFPAYLAVFLMYFLILRRVTTNVSIALVVAAWGSMAPNVRILYFHNFTSIRVALTVLVVFLIYFQFSSQSRPVRRRLNVVLTGFIIWMFYWYPPNVGTLLILSVLMSGVVVFSRRHNARRFLYIGLVSVLLMYEIFRLPLPVYEHYIVSAMLNIAVRGLSIGGSSGGGLPPTIIGSKYYSIIPLITLLPLGAIGGIVALRRAREFFESGRHLLEVLLVMWGVTVVVRGLVYFGTNEAWLITRPYINSLPIMVIAGGIGLHYIHRRFSRVVNAKTVLVLLLVLSVPIVGTTYLQSTDPRTAIQTYDSDYGSVANWMVGYDPGIAVTDVKTGAPIVTAGYYKVKHPKEYRDFSAVFYSENRTEYTSAAQRLDSKVLVLSESMTRTGLYGTSQHHVPMSSSRVEQRERENNLLFDNGRRTVVKFD